MVLAAPHHKTAAKAHDAFFDVDHPRFAPSFVQPVTRPLAIELLEQLVQRGVFGRSTAEVAGRFVDRALQRFIEQPKLKVKLTPKSQGGSRKEED